MLSELYIQVRDNIGTLKGGMLGGRVEKSDENPSIKPGRFCRGDNGPCGRADSISRREALSLRSSLRSLTQLERRYSRNALNNEERQDLQRRLRSLRQEKRQADNGARRS